MFPTPLSLHYQVNEDKFVSLKIVLINDSNYINHIYVVHYLFQD